MLVCVRVSEAGVWVAWEDGVGWGRRCRIVGRWVGGNQIAYHGTFLSPLLRLPVRYYAILFVLFRLERRSKILDTWLSNDFGGSSVSLYLKKARLKANSHYILRNQMPRRLKLDGPLNRATFSHFAEREEGRESATFRTTSGALTR